MSIAERDVGMDYLKGFTCMLMILAHLPVFDKSEIVAQHLVWSINSATVLFFGFSGVNAVSQAKKYSLGYLVKINAALFFFGIAYSAIVHPDIYSRFLFEIFQIIAVGSLLSALLYRQIGDNLPVFAIIGLVIAGAKYVLEWLFPDFHGGGLLLVHEKYVPHTELQSGDVRYFPGFPFFPWAYIFFWGVFAYQLSQKAQAILIAVEVFVLVVGLYAGVLGDWREKWDMSPAFLIISMICFSLGCLIVRWVPERWLTIQSFVVMSGKNSLAFLFVHGFGLLGGFLVVKMTGQFGAWAVAYLVTYLGMKLFLKWKPFAIFDRQLSWFILGALVLIVPVLAVYWPQTKGIVVLSEAILGLLFAKHFVQLRKIIISAEPRKVVTS